MDGYATYVLRHAKNEDFSIDFAIFTKALRTDGPTNAPIDRRTEKPSYRDAIAASKNAKSFHALCTFIETDLRELSLDPSNS